MGLTKTPNCLATACLTGICSGANIWTATPVARLATEKLSLCAESAAAGREFNGQDGGGCGAISALTGVGAHLGAG